MATAAGTKPASSIHAGAGLVFLLGAAIFLNYVDRGAIPVAAPLMKSELGLSAHRFPNPWKSAASASLSTAVGAFIPIIPFFFMSGLPAVIVAFVVSIVAHFAVGAVKSLITIRSWWASGFEMTLVGVIEAVVTYGLGLAFGAIV